MRKITILMLVLIAACSTGGGAATVTGTGPDELLKLRAGPGLQFNILMGLPDGTKVQRQNCVTELGQRWCRVTLATAPQVSGYVSADYLTAP